MSVTKAGHDPEALSILVAALTPYVEEAERFRIAVDVFGVLHDAGLRLVPSARIDGSPAGSGEALAGSPASPPGLHIDGRDDGR